MIRIGVGPGMSIILYEDGTVGHKGGQRDEVLRSAAYKIRCGDLPDEKIAAVRKWLALMLETIDREQLEQQVEEEHSKRMKAAARETKKPPLDLRTLVEGLIRKLLPRLSRTARSRDDRISTLHNHSAPPFLPMPN